MGYEIHFKPSVEKMETYKPWGYDKPNYESEEKHIEGTRLEILTYCLKEHKDGLCFQIQKQIEFFLKLLSSQIEGNEKEFAYKRWSEDEDHELWYSGWAFSHESDENIELVLKDTVENLVILATVVETPDYFSDRENFWEKHKAISNYLADFISIMEDHYIHQIINDLDEFKVNDDDYAEDTQAQVKRMVENNEETVDETFARIATELLPTKKGKTDEENNEEEYGLMNCNGDKDFD